MRVSTWLCAACLALAVAGAPTIAPAQAPKVSSVIRVDVNNDVPGFLEIAQKFRALAGKLDRKSTIRVWQSTLAGPETNSIIVVVEYANLVQMAEEVTANNENEEWLALVQEFQGKGYSILSNSLVQEITP